MWHKILTILSFLCIYTCPAFADPPLSQDYPHICTKSVFSNGATGGFQSLITPVMGQNVYICGIEYNAINTTSISSLLLGGYSGGQCTSALGIGTVIDAFYFPTVSGETLSPISSIYYRGLNTGVSNGLCLEVSTPAPTYSIMIYYEQE